MKKVYALDQTPIFLQGAACARLLIQMIVKTHLNHIMPVHESRLCLQSRLAATGESCLHVFLDCMVKIVNMDNYQ